MSDLVTEPSELDDPRSLQISAGLIADGEEPTEKVQVDYFAPEPDATTFLPDGVSYVTHKKLTEGDRKAYLKVVNKDIKIQKGTGDALMRLASGEERTALLQVALTGWNLVSGGSPLPFNPQNLRKFLDNGRVEVLEVIEKAVRKNNPWLMSDVTVEDIDAEIESLQEQRQLILDRESGKDASSDW